MELFVTSWLFILFPLSNIYLIYIKTFIYLSQKLVTISILIPENVLAQGSNWNGKNQRRTVMQWSRNTCSDWTIAIMLTPVTNTIGLLSPCVNRALLILSKYRCVYCNKKIFLSKLILVSAAMVRKLAFTFFFIKGKCFRKCLDFKATLKSNVHSLCHRRMSDQIFRL